MPCCRSCGRENPGDANFCAGCGAPLGERARQERKVVTVVFCDLVGFTGRAERLDPEDVRALLQPYHARLRDELERFGGTVEKFIGDAVVGVFGAPVAHEDDAERAVRAALAIRDWARGQEQIEVRIGVNSGEALVSLDADPARGEGMVAGDVINTAARLQSAAPVNGILVGEQARLATDRSIIYAEHESVAAKGKALPVAVWEVLEPVARVGAAAAAEPKTLFVGRERELALLRDAFVRARDEHEPQLVTLVAVPGAGKSRLVYELARIVDADSRLVSWRQGQCLPYGDGVSYWPLAEIVKGETGILESDDAETAAAKLAASTDSLLPAEERAWVQRRLRPLVGLGGQSATQGSRAESFAAWSRYLEALAERGPTVLVFEDLHWADDDLLDFLDELVDAAAGLPLLLVATSRPELLARRPGWGGGKVNAVTLSLPPLSDEETATLVHALLDRSVLAAPVQQALLARTAGNPLYVEEFARMVGERRDAELAVPETVQGIIAARIDALSADEKQLLQAAAVIGATFWAGAAAALAVEQTDVEAVLRRLERREFVRRERRPSIENESEYAFRHVLVRDVAFGQIPRAERSEYHRRAAGWIASLGRPDDQAELLAHHALEALRYARAAGADTGGLTGPAQAAARTAGERAFRLAAYRQAARFFDAALELAGQDDPEHAYLLYRSGAAHFWGDGTGDEWLAAAVPALRAAGRREQAAQATLLLARIAWHRADREAVARRLDEVDRLLEDLPESEVQVEALVVRGGFHMVAGEHDRSIPAAREALRRLQGIDRPDLRARAFDILGFSRSGLGDEGGLADQRRAIEIARAGRAVWELHHAINNSISSEMRFGRLRGLDRLIEEWRTAATEIGSTLYNRTWLLGAEAETAYLLGRWDDAVEAIDRFLALIDGGSHYLEPGARALRATIELARRAPAAAAEDMRRAADLAVGYELQMTAPVECRHAAYLLASGREAVARAGVERLLGIHHGLDEALAIAAVVPEFAWLAHDLGYAEAAAAVFSDSPFTRWATAARAILDNDPAAAADLLAEIGHRPAEAYARLRAGGTNLPQARAFFDSVGATHLISGAAPTARSSF